MSEIVCRVNLRRLRRPGGPTSPIARRGTRSCLAANTSERLAGEIQRMNMKSNNKTSAVAAVLVALGTLTGTGMPGVGAARSDHYRPPACQPPPPPEGPSRPPELKTTTITTIGQGYFCILATHFR